MDEKLSTKSETHFITYRSCNFFQSCNFALLLFTNFSSLPLFFLSRVFHDKSILVFLKYHLALFSDRRETHDMRGERRGRWKVDEQVHRCVVWLDGVRNYSRYPRIINPRRRAGSNVLALPVHLFWEGEIREVVSHLRERSLAVMPARWSVGLAAR